MSIDFTKNANTEKTMCLNIVGGPGVDRLIDAFKYAYAKTSCVKAEFKVTGRGSNEFITANDVVACSVQIQSLEHEDSSGYSFHMKGRFKTAAGDGLQVSFCGLKFKGFYNAQYRRGHMIISRQ